MVVGTRLAEKGKPTGFTRFLTRAPLALYHARLGFLLGRRFLRLVHVGRKSGQPREVVLEVIRIDDDGAVTAACGWGEKADWLRNVTATPECEVTVATRTFEARAERRSMDDAVAILTDYAAAHPRAFGKLTQLMLGRPHPPDAEGARALAAAVPVVTFRPRS